MREPSGAALPDPAGPSPLHNAQTMKASPVMLIKRIFLYIFLLMLAHGNNQVYGSNATDCPMEIRVRRLSQYQTYVGGSLAMECPVHYCQTKPSMQWCRMEGASCEQLQEGRAHWKSDSVFILEISPVHQNHSGRFQCRAEDGKLSTVSHEIRVIVEEKPVNITVSPENTTSISEESLQSGNSKTLFIIYTSAPLGLCCLFITGCMFWCLKRRHAKQKRTPLAQQREEMMVRSPAAAPSHAAGTTQASQESSFIYCPMASPLHALKDNVIYDNSVPPWNAQRTAPNAPHSNPGVPSTPVLPESPDGLTYAVLNHSASAEKRQRREEKTAVNEITEYACINVHR